MKAAAKEDTEFLLIQTRLLSELLIKNNVDKFNLFNLFNMTNELENNLLNALNATMDTSIKLLNLFDPEFLPAREKDDYSANAVKNFLTSKKKGRKSPEAGVDERINRALDKMPKGMFDVFLDCGHILSYTVVKIHATHRQWREEFEGSEIPSDNFSQALIAGMIGLKGGFSLTEPIFPFTYLLKTMLGPDIIKVMIMDSQEGRGKIQPHECSRQNWVRLQNMSGQVKLEDELIYFNSIEPFKSKLVVAAAWTLLSLMASMDPSTFLSESDPHLSSTRSGGMTWSIGSGTHKFPVYYPYSMCKVIKVLKEMLKIETLDSFDMFWVASNTARLHSIEKAHGSRELSSDERFDLFLSHRGQDSKKDLMEEILRKGISNKSVFLDCLSLPKKIINRNFLYKSLANSKKILLVKTKNFNGSQWCVKEETVAKLLEKNDLCNLQVVRSTADAIKHIDLIRTGGKSQAKDKKARKMPPKYVPWTTVRILRDGDDQLLAPNFYQVSKLGYSTKCFEEILKWVSGGYKKFLLADQGNKTSGFILAMYDSIIKQFFKPKSKRKKDKPIIPIEIWATASQLSIAALCLGSMNYDKLDTRKYTSSSNSLCQNILTMIASMDVEEDAKNKLLNYTLIANGAIALELYGKNLEPINNCGISQLVYARGLLKEGLILVDFRDLDNADWGLLPLISIMLRDHDIGTIGILQDIKNPIHQKQIQGFNIEVLPCITFHPGMEKIFE